MRRPAVIISNIHGHGYRTGTFGYVGETMTKGRYKLYQSQSGALTVEGRISWMTSEEFTTNLTRNPSLLTAIHNLEDKASNDYAQKQAEIALLYKHYDGKMVSPEIKRKAENIYDAFRASRASGRKSEAIDLIIKALQ